MNLPLKLCRCCRLLLSSPTSKAKRSRSKRLPYVIRYYLQTVAVPYCDRHGLRAPAASSDDQAI